jgi:hypothetical protein
LTAIDDFPRDLALSKCRGKWVLEIDAPGLFSGNAESTSRACVEAVAEACAAVRRDFPAVTA